MKVEIIIDTDLTIDESIALQNRIIDVIVGEFDISVDDYNIIIKQY